MIRLFAVVLALAVPVTAKAEDAVTTFTLDNGMEVVVIEDNRAPVVVQMREAVTHMIDELFPFFMSNPNMLPKQWRKDVEAVSSETALARIVSDYIAGMTDRFAIQQHGKLVGGTPVPPGVTDGN